MTYFEALLLVCYQSLKGDRSRASAYHLFTGKKTSQTIQDAHLYGVDPLFQTFPLLKRARFEQIVDRLIEQGYVMEDADRILITDKGQYEAEQYFSQKSFPSGLQGWYFHDRVREFWQRLTLFVQVVSNVKYRDNRFLPVQQQPEIQQWVKSYFSYRKDERLPELLYNELIALFSSRSFTGEPAILIHQLSGHRMMGKTLQQLARESGMETDEGHYLFLHSLHIMLSLLERAPADYPILSEMLTKRDRQSILTNSTKSTYRYIQYGHTMEEIAAARNLKLSTIEDHIIELALMIPEFPVDSYVSAELQSEIRRIIRRGQYRKLKEMKDELPAASYFQLRLVVVKEGRGASVWSNYCNSVSVTPPSGPDSGKSLKVY